MRSEDFRDSRQRFKASVMKDTEKFLGQGSKSIFIEMRYFRELCLREIGWCRICTNRKKTEIMLNARRNDTKKVKKLKGDILLMAEITRIRRRQSATTRELIEKRDFRGFLEFLERLE